MSNTSAVRVTPISGTGGKSAACFLVETDSARLLLDLGEQGGRLPDLSKVGAIDAVLISHGHADHIGGLDLIEQVGTPPIYATALTRAFAGHPLLAKARDLPLRGKITIAGTTIDTGRAGHSAGGVWMRIGGIDGVLYTGDLCRESILYPVDTPLPTATLVADASYGLYDNDLKGNEQEMLARARRASLLLPLPPTGRGIEIAVLMSEAGLRVSLCAQHQHIARLMTAAPEALVDNGVARLSAMLENVSVLDAESPPSGVMVAGNGGATGGVSRVLLERFVETPGVQIVFTGYLESETKASAAIAAGRAEYLRWNVHPRLGDLAWLHSVVRPSQTIYAFCTPREATDLAQALHRSA